MFKYDNGCLINTILRLPRLENNFKVLILSYSLSAFNYSLSNFNWLHLFVSLTLDDTNPLYYFFQCFDEQRTIFFPDINKWGEKRKEKKERSATRCIP